MNGLQSQLPATRRRRPVLLLVAAALVAIVVGGSAYWAIACPCGRLPGLYLRGREASEAVTDWSFANQVPLCQIQVDAGLLSHALNLNCWADRTGDLYLSCAGCDGKRWSSAAIANNQARLRLDSTVYPVTLTRVLDDAELDRAWESRAVKIGSVGSAARPDGWWSFRVVSR
jgi:hypothetical protein